MSDHVTYGRALVLLAALRYVMHFVFMDDVILSHRPKQLNVDAQLTEA